MKTSFILSIGVLGFTTGVLVFAENQIPNIDLQQQQVQPVQVRNNMGRNLQQVPRNGVQNMQVANRAVSVSSQLAGERHMTASEVRKAVDRAIAFLHSCQAEDGSIHEGTVHYSQGAGTVMSALAMLASGADPVSDLPLHRALEWLKKNPQENTYFRAVRANVWQYALRKSPEDAELRAALEDDYKWLMKALGKKEGWRYLKTSSDWDNSVTQYGVLGVWAACRAGFDPGNGFWHRMSKHFRDKQNDDGGWSYTSGGSNANMATAGLATMFLVFDMFHGRQYYQADKGNPFAEGEAADCLESISRGMKWLGEHGGDNGDGYYLYGIERTGVASGRKFIGGHDWFREGVKSIFGAQRQDGAIPLRGYGNTRINTAFATLFMVYGGAPVAFNKLDYGEGQSWNLNPRDIANVTKHLWEAYEQPLNWFSVNIDAPAEEFEAPILFISGSEKVEFSEEQVDKLRSYIERGGMILAEPSDNSPAFRESMVTLLDELYPSEQYAGRGFTAVAAQDPIYTVLKQEWESLPELQAARIGSRVMFVMSDSYLSKDWQMNHTHTDAFKLAMNLIFYATDRGSLYARFHSVLPDTIAAENTERNLRVARLQHIDSRVQMGEWKVGEEVLPAFAPFFSHVHGVAIDDAGVVDVDDALPEDVPLLLLSGHTKTHLGERDAKVLHAYLESGGTLLVDASAGSEGFAGEMRSWIEKELGSLSALPDTHPLSVGRFPGGFDLTSGVRFTLPARRKLREESLDPSAQQLEAVVIDGRAAVIFSRFGLSGAVTGARDFGAAAYRPASARKVLSNVCAYVLDADV